LSATVFGAPADTKSDLLRHFSPQYTQITDSSLSTFDDFLAHITHLRTVTTGGAVQVEEALRDGSMADATASASSTSMAPQAASRFYLSVNSMTKTASFGWSRRLALAGDHEHANLGTAVS
jgi:hypothetical protein